MKHLETPELCKEEEIELPSRRMPLDRAVGSVFG